MSQTPIASLVERSLRDFMTGMGRDVPELTADTDLIRATGATSDEGVDFAIDLSDAVGTDLPADFNPFVHESGERGMRFGELVARVTTFLSGRKEAGDV